MADDSFLDSIINAGSSAWDYITDFDFSDDGSTGLLEDIGGFFTTSEGGIDWGKVAGVGGGVASALGLFGGNEQRPTGYQGGIPSYLATRQQVPVAEIQAPAQPAAQAGQTSLPPTMIPSSYDPNRRPGSGGRRYFTDVRYTAPSGGDAARAAAAQEAAALMRANIDNPARQERRMPPAMPPAPPAGMAMGGQVNRYAPGGLAAMAPSRYLNSNADGMADTIPSMIDGQDPAALSGGEFVVAADVVSGLGNGNSNAGAKQLYEMMDRVRKARTGTTKQGKQINPQRTMPA